MLSQTLIVPRFHVLGFDRDYWLSGIKYARIMIAATLILDAPHHHHFEV